MRLPREFYIPKHSTKVADKLSDAVAYISQFVGPNGERYVAMGFVGKAQKPSFHYTFKTEERRAAYVREFFTNRQAAIKSVSDRREKRKAEGRGLVVGDVLRSSWGYEQTNIDYYEVTALIGDTMVELRELCQERLETAWMQGKCVPMPGSYTKAEPMRRVAKSGVVAIESWRHASKVEPHVVAGVKVYQSSHWTAYH